MKRYILSLLCVLASVVSTWAANRITLSSPSGDPGGEVTVSVSLQNTDQISALQLSIPLGQYLTYVKESAVLESARSNDHVLSASSADGVLKLVVYSATNAVLQGTSGKLLSFKLKLSRACVVIPLTPEVEASSASGTTLSCDATAGEVTILAPMIEVQPTSVNYGHVPIREAYSQDIAIENTGTAELNIQLSTSASAFEPEGTSYTIAPGSSQYVSVNYSPIKRGAVSEKLIIQSDASNERYKEVILVADPYSVNELHIEDASGNADDEVEIALTMNNMEPIVGVECELKLPDELQYVDGSFKTSQRSAQLTAGSLKKNGVLTLMLYSLNNAPIDEGDGVIGTFRVRLNGQSGLYTVKPQKVELVNATQENMTSDYTEGYVTIESPVYQGEGRLSFGKFPVTESGSAVYTISNSGDVNLVVSRITFLSGNYEIAESLPLTLEPEESFELHLKSNPSAPGEFSDKMQIYTNDPNNRVKTVTMSGFAYEPNGLILVGEPANDCQDYHVSVGLDNYRPIVALQFDIHWMEGVTLNSSDVVSSSRAAGMNVSVAKVGDGTWRVILYSMSNATIPAGVGDLCQLKFKGNGQNFFNTTITIDNVEISSAEGTDVNTTKAVSHSVKAPEFHLQYVVDGEVYKTITLAYGAAVTPESAPTKEGHTFSGWSEIPETMPAHDVEVTGSFSVNNYTLTYKVDGEVYKTITLAYGAAITPESAPTKEGHTFSGWSVIPETMPAHDVEVTGSFSVNSYTLTYKVDGEVYKTITLAYGAAITPESAPTKEGYTFSGWSEIPETMPAHDVEVTGSLSIMTYKVILSVGEGGEAVVSNQTPEYGSSVVLTITPNDGYEIASVVMNEVDMTASLIDGQLSIEKVSSDIYITVSFTVVDGLDSLLADDAVLTTTDLNGRSVYSIRPGQIYIQNGRKMLKR